MNILPVLCALPFALAGSALAQSVSPGAPQQLLITISKPDCSRLIRHVPRPDVAYRPGVDVHGRPVAPADLDPAGAELARRVVPDVLQFPIRLNPMTYMNDRKGQSGPDYAQGLEHSQATIGTVRYDVATDTFTFNGQPLVSDDQRRLAEACARYGVH